ncbi:MAG: YetF domain-containing protein [Bacillota bacterium]
MTYSLKVLIIFILVFLVFRIMGKRTVMQLTNYDIASIMILSIVASAPIVTADLEKTLYGLTLLLVLHIFILSISRNSKISDYIFGKPKILIKKGKISEEEMKSAKLTMPQLISELRQMGYSNVADVEFAILENTGKLSIVSSNRKPLPLVIDGKVLEDNLNYAGYDHDWLLKKIEEQGIVALERVSLATVDGHGKITVIESNIE